MAATRGQRGNGGEEGLREKKKRRGPRQRQRAFEVLYLPRGKGEWRKRKKVGSDFIPGPK